MSMLYLHNVILSSVPVNLPVPFEDTYSAAVTTLTDTACTYSGYYSGPRCGVAAYKATLKMHVMMMMNDIFLTNNSML